MTGAPHPFVAVITAPEVMAALISVIVAICGTIAIQLRALQERLKKRIDDVHATAEAAREQVTNHHGSNLRDDLDALAAQMREGLAAIQAAQNRADERAERERGERVNEVRLIREELGRMREDIQAQREDIQAQRDALTAHVVH